MRVLLPGSNRKPYTIYRVLKSIDNVAASKIMPLFGEIGLGHSMNYQNLLNHIESGHLKEVKIGKC